MKVYAVIPAYMEGRSIGEVISKTKAHVDKVVVVDDGSTDDTSQQAFEADIVLRHPVNMNKGFTMLTGIDAAVMDGADIIVTIDADGQHDPADIPRFVDEIRNRGYDIVYGSRGLDSNMPLIPRFGNWWLSTMVRIIYGVHISDTQSGFRVFTKEAYRKIRWESQDYRVETEMIVNAAKAGLAFKELRIKTVYKCNYKGTTVIDGIKIFTSMIIWRITK